MNTRKQRRWTYIHFFKVMGLFPLRSWGDKGSERWSTLLRSHSWKWTREGLNPHLPGPQSLCTASTNINWFKSLSDHAEAFIVQSLGLYSSGCFCGLGGLVPIVQMENDSCETVNLSMITQPFSVTAEIWLQPKFKLFSLNPKVPPTLEKLSPEMNIHRYKEIYKPPSKTYLLIESEILGKTLEVT